MREEWRSVSTRPGGPFAVGHPGTTTGELQMEEWSVDNLDIKNWVSVCCVMFKVLRKLYI